MSDSSIKSYVGLQSILGMFETDKYDIMVKLISSDTMSISIYRRIHFLGLKISMKKPVITYTSYVKKYTIDDVNPIFKNDTAVDFASYMRYAEKGFNENKINVLHPLKGISIPNDIRSEMEEFNYKLDLLNTCVGMAGEVGEMLEIIKKNIYHDKPYKGEDMLSEASDVLWYYTNFLRLLDISLSDTIRANQTKLNMRYPNGRDKNYTITNKHMYEEENNAIKKENSLST